MRPLIPPEPDPLSLSAGDVARTLGVALSTVKRLADAGTLRCVRIPAPGRRDIRRFRPSWVREFIAAHDTMAQKDGAK